MGAQLIFHRFVPCDLLATFCSGVVEIVRDAAGLLSAASQRLSQLLAELHGAEDLVQSCGAAGRMFCDTAVRMGRESGDAGMHARVVSKGCEAGLAVTSRNHSMPSLPHAVHRRSDPVSRAIALIDAELHIDSAALQAIVVQASSALAFVEGLAPHFALPHLT